MDISASLSKGRSVILESQEGIHQGDTLGPALLSCAIHRMLLDIQNRHPAVAILAYLDDVLFCGPTDSSQLAFEDLQHSFS